MITTAEINRVLREGPYGRWAYFIDEDADRVGVVFANDETFAAYYVTDTPDPKLVEYGLEPIAGLTGMSDPEYLILEAGDNRFQGRIFATPMMVDEDDMSPSFTADTLLDWQTFLVSKGIQLTEGAVRRPIDRIVPVVAAIVFLGLIILWLV